MKDKSALQLFKKGKVMSCMIAITLLVNLMYSPTVLAAQNTEQYKGRWSEAIVQKWMDKNVWEGNDVNFEPTADITGKEFNRLFQGMLDGEASLVLGDVVSRIEAVTAIYNYLGETVNEDVMFQDMDTYSEPERLAIKTLVHLGLIQGYPDGYFYGRNTLTQEQAVVMLDRLVDYKNAFHVTAQNYVDDAGYMMKGLSYNVNDTFSQEDVQGLSFDIEFTIPPNTWLGETENKKEKAVIKSVKLEDNMLTVTFEPTNSANLLEATVDSSDDRFDSVKGRFDKTTPIVDAFKKHSFTASNNTMLTYWLYTPEDAENVPLMIWEHGGGEVLSSSYEGANLVANRGAVAWIEEGYNTAVLSVQYPENYAFGITEVPDELEQMHAFNLAKFELVNHLIDEGIIDKSRIYISGASSGGGGALRFLMDYPELFAGGLLMCTKDTLVPMSLKYDLAYKLDNTDDLRITQEQYDESYALAMKELKGNRIVDVPLWIVHAKNDQVCTSYTSIILDEALTELGSTEHHLSIYSDEEMEDFGVHQIYHGVWTPTLHNKEIMDWMYNQVND